MKDAANTICRNCRTKICKKIVTWQNKKEARKMCAMSTRHLPELTALNAQAWQQGSRAKGRAVNPVQSQAVVLAAWGLALCSIPGAALTEALDVERR